MASRAPKTKSLNWFFVQICLFAIPFVFLALLAAYLLRRDKASVEQEARERVTPIAEGLLKTIAASLTNFDRADYFDLMKAWPGGTAVVRMDAHGALVFPPPIIRSPAASRSLLLSEESNLWVEAQAAEFRSNNLPASIELWDQLLKHDMPEPARLTARFERAVVLDRTGDAVQAEAEFRAIAQAQGDAWLDSGLPVSALAAWKWMRVDPAHHGPDENDEREAAAHSYASNLLAHPFALTPQLLTNNPDGPFHDAFTNALNIWKKDQVARDLYRQLSEPKMEGSGLRKLKLNGAEWRILVVNGSDSFFRSNENIMEEVRRIRHEMALAFPAYCGLSISLDDLACFRDVPFSFAGLPWMRSTLKLSSGSLLQCDVFLTNPALLYSRQTVRARIFTLLLMLATLSAAFGLAWAHRSFRREARLNELKSNFISSVSHELRAPLASMRLLSEGLQTGRIADIPKQREYFGFLVQECRRLSSLVENVLDFSRIEQNRRTYTMENADIREIGAAAVRTVSPIAEERGVKVLYEQSAGDEVIAKVDALAMQQALVNLLDNAIKHSPPGESVRLELSEALDAIRFTVTDKGPGIPLSEQKKIFERFYRLGSELRRETEGVGIGLSIVKHIVDAHGGHIEVRSRPGAGAEFIVIVPRGTMNAGVGK
jgi:signal transduction histidine kinase